MYVINSRPSDCLTWRSLVRARVLTCEFLGVLAITEQGQT